LCRAWRARVRDSTAESRRHLALLTPVGLTRWKGPSVKGLLPSAGPARGHESMTANWTGSSNNALWVCVLCQTYSKSTGASSKLDVQRNAWRKPTYQSLRCGLAQSKHAFCSAKLGCVLTCPARMSTHGKTHVLSQRCKSTLKLNSTTMPSVSYDAADAECAGFT